MIFDQLLAMTSAGGAPTRLDPLKLFLDADIVVQVVMAGLLLASIWVWMIIVSFSLRMGTVSRKCDSYEAGFWEAPNFESFQKERKRAGVPLGKVAGAGLGEWKRNAAIKTLDLEGARQRITVAMGSAVGEEADALANRLNFLATVGSVAPFVGLFGTVWGIMKSFQAIAVQKNTSLAIVAPSIAEALFATAIGLVAAIPAYIAYNAYSTAAGKYSARLEGFADDLSTAIQRRLSEKA